MIISELFQGDSIRIANIQHDSYDQALLKIVRFATEKHRKAGAILAVRTELCDKRDDLMRFDHRTLQWLHDSIAGAFRWKYCLNADLFTDASFSPDSAEDIAQLWFDFLHSELERIFDIYLRLPHWILTSIIYANPDPRGMAAEDELYEMTRMLYPELRWSGNE